MTTDNVILFPHKVAPINPIAHYIRLGETGYRKLGDLHAAGKLPATRIVVDASRFHHQKDLIASFREQGAEIVLDTKAAELAAKEKYRGYARHAPWASASDGDLLGPTYFQNNTPTDVIGQIARFAVEHNLDTVLAPAHFINDPSYDHWLQVDHKMCIYLRRALDRLGGTSIAIDYPLIVAHTALNNDTIRSEVLARLADLPFDNLWIRASGFGSDAAPLSTRRFITHMANLHNLGKPIIADYLGGLIGNAALAFGAVSGIAHGIGERERFNARTWHKTPANKDGRHGRPTRILLPSLHRSVSIKELELLVRARGGRKLVACGDRKCCLHGLKDMVRDPRQHAAYQSFQNVHKLSNIPDLHREQYFIDNQLTEYERHAGQLSTLKIPAEEASNRNIDPNQFAKKLTDLHKRATNLLSTLENLHEEYAGTTPRARPVAPRIPITTNDRAGKS